MNANGIDGTESILDGGDRDEWVMQLKTGSSIHHQRQLTECMLRSQAGDERTSKQTNEQTHPIGHEQ